MDEYPAGLGNGKSGGGGGGGGGDDDLHSLWMRARSAGCWRYDAVYLKHASRRLLSGNEQFRPPTY